MPENSRAKTGLQFILEERFRLSRDRQIALVLAFCWVGTLFIGGILGGLFTLAGLGEFVFGRGSAERMAAFGGMACACAVVPYVVSRSLEGIVRARILGPLLDDVEKREVKAP